MAKMTEKSKKNRKMDKNEKAYLKAGTIHKKLKIEKLIKKFGKMDKIGKGQKL